MKNVVFLISTQRSGTKLFQSILNTSEEIKCYGEIFHPLDQDKEHNFWYFKSNILSSQDRDFMAIPTQENLEKIFVNFLEYLKTITNKEIVLCDVMYNNIQFFTPVWQETFHLPFLVKCLIRQRIPVIHLIRKNLLESYCSAKRAKVTNIYHSIDKTVQQKGGKITLDIDDVVQAMNRKQEEVHLFRSLFKRYPKYLEIFYPDFFTVEDKNLCESVKADVSQLLNIPNLETASSDLVKTSPRLDEYINNFSEVISCLSEKKVAYLVE